jgi:hypothetical protein
VNVGGLRGDGTRAPIPASAGILGNASEVFALTPPSGNRIDATRMLRCGGDEVRVERIALDNRQFVRLL